MDLHPGEKIIFEGHPSWRSTLGFYLKGLVVSLVAAGVVAAATALGDGIDWPLVIVVFVIGESVALLVGFVSRWTTVYTITNERLRIKHGLIARRVQQTEVGRVQNVNTSQSVLERVLQVGTVDFDTAGTDDSEFRFAGVEDPEEVVAAIDRAREANAAPAAGV
jgi:uncharacterized membrane protein YdbT with pleckstrin-like domain